MIDRGATTIWEDWDGIDDDGVAHASLNHYSKGAVISFLHDYVAGIRLLDDGPGYRHFRIAPLPGGGLTWASAPRLALRPHRVVVVDARRARLLGAGAAEHRRRGRAARRPCRGVGPGLATFHSR